MKNKINWKCVDVTINHGDYPWDIPQLEATLCGQFTPPMFLERGDFTDLTNEIDRLLDNHCEIKRVIFNNPATIIYWKDGTKTVVKCQPGDTWDEEKGFMAAYLKKLLGNDNTFNKLIKRYCIADYLPDYLKEE